MQCPLVRQAGSASQSGLSPREDTSPFCWSARPAFVFRFDFLCFTAVNFIRDRCVLPKSRRPTAGNSHMHSSRTRSRHSQPTDGTSARTEARKKRDNNRSNAAEAKSGSCGLTKPCQRFAWFARRLANRTPLICRLGFLQPRPARPLLCCVALRCVAVAVALLTHSSSCPTSLPAPSVVSSASKESPGHPSLCLVSLTGTPSPHPRPHHLRSHPQVSTAAPATQTRRRYERCAIWTPSDSVVSPVIFVSLVTTSSGTSATSPIRTGPSGSKTFQISANGAVVHKPGVR